MQKLGIWSSENIWRLFPKTKSSVTENCTYICPIFHKHQIPKTSTIMYHHYAWGKYHALTWFLCTTSTASLHIWDGSTSMGERALHKRVSQPLPSSTSGFSAAVLLGVSKSDIKVAKQNQAGQTKVNLIACKLGLSTWQTESKLISLWQQQRKDISKQFLWFYFVCSKLTEHFYLRSWDTHKINANYNQ